MLGVALRAGYTPVTEAEDASTIVVNTCGFIGEAKKESIDTILEMEELKKLGSCKKLIVSGCLTQRYPEEIAEGMRSVDHLLGSSDMLKLEAILRGKEKDRMLVGNPAEWVIRASDPRVLSNSSVSAYVKIAEGCNRKCSFCTIPSFRGKQRSRSVADVVEECKSLVAQGVSEICLISQDTISYGRDKGVVQTGPRDSLANLVEAVANVAGVQWVRLFYLYPETIDPALVELLRSHPRVVPYVDMPLQHAADAMLKRMKRGHGIDRQKRVVDHLRKQVPNLWFRTAFIVGHPGETESEFEELVSFVEWAQFEHMGVFRYSDEETTASFDIEEKVPPAIAAKRNRKLMSLQRKISRKKNKTLVGQSVEVLVEGISEEHEFVMKGRHRGQAPEIDGQVFLSGEEVRAGDLVRATISQASDYDLVGEVTEILHRKKMVSRKKSLPQITGSDTATWR